MQSNIKLLGNDQLENVQGKSQAGGKRVIDDGPCEKLARITVVLRVNGEEIECV